MVPQPFERYTLRINAELDERISNHIQNLKKLEDGYYKKKWIQEAIREKLESINLEGVKADQSLGFSVSRYLIDEVSKTIADLKKMGVKKSKTDFFLEAIHEKLERDETRIKCIFQNMIKTVAQKVSAK
jgi:hypothetical protein